MSTTDFAILAPVPIMHLESGAPIASSKGYVSFGSQKWELFRDVDKLRHSHDVPVLIYASHETDEAKLSFQVTWSAWYVGHVDDGISKRNDEKNGHRPPTTASNPHDNSSGWALFWRVRDLKPLSADHHHSIK